MSFFQNAAMSFTIITILTAITGLFSTGLNYGGAAAITYGWPLVCHG
jgi:hypothetical protein